MSAMVPLVIVGLGRMGGLALRVARRLEAEVRPLAGVDPDPEARRRAAGLLGGDEVWLTPSLDEALARVGGTPAGCPVLVYDAAPPAARPANIRGLRGRLPPGSVILAEKPLALSPAEAAAALAGPEPVLGDFLEVANPAFGAVCRHLRGLPVRRLTFWRASAIGLDLLTGRVRRAGVQGGSLLDKAVHDLALIRALTGPGEARVRQAAALGWMPASPEGGLLGLDGRPLGLGRLGQLPDYALGRDGGPADAAFHLELELPRPWGVVGARVLSGWVGLMGTRPEREILQELAALGFRTEDVVHRRWGSEEVRLAIIEAGDGVRLVVDFLRPRVWAAGKAGRRPIFEAADFDYETAKESALGEVFRRALQTLRTGRDDPLIGGEVVAWVHGVLFGARALALRQSLGWVYTGGGGPYPRGGESAV